MQYFTYTSTDGKTTANGQTTVSTTQPSTYLGVQYTDPTAFLRAVYGDPTAVVVLTSTPPITKTTLTVYAGQKQSNLLATGITVNVAASGAAAVNVLCDGTLESRSDLQGLYLSALGSSAFSTEWEDNLGTVTALTAAEILVFAPAIRNWYSNMVIALATVKAAITAGTITTTAQIDSYAWPTS